MTKSTEYGIYGVGLAAVAGIWLLIQYQGFYGWLLLGLGVLLLGYVLLQSFKLDVEARHRIYAILFLLALQPLFWALFEQAGSSLNFLAQDFGRMPEVTIFGWQPTFEVFQSVNPVFIILLAPMFASLWPALDGKALNPSIPRKFAYGLAGAAIGFYVLVFAIQNFVDAGGKISWMWLTLTYLIHTMGELCLSPIGLAMVTKLAMPKETGLAMGGWFLSIAMANYVAGLLAAEASGHYRLTLAPTAPAELAGRAAGGSARRA